MIGNRRSKTAIKQGIWKYSQGMKSTGVTMYLQAMYWLISCLHQWVDIDLSILSFQTLKDAALGLTLTPGRLHA